MKPVLKYYDNGQLEYELWYVDGKPHRLNGPAYQEWYENGHLRYEEWYVNGVCHRLNGPARQLWHENGQLCVESWLVDGEYHRLNGPAFQEWCENGQLFVKDWYFNRINYEKEEHPFNIFREEHGLKETYEEWPADMKFLFEVIYK